MQAASGIPPVAIGTAGTADRPAASPALQAEAAKGRKADLYRPLTTMPVRGATASDAAAAPQPRRVSSQGDQPDHDSLTGPRPTFDFTPLEQLKYPPSPLETLARQLREVAEHLKREVDHPTLQQQTHDQPDTEAPSEVRPTYPHRPEPDESANRLDLVR